MTIRDKSNIRILRILGVIVLAFGLFLLAFFAIPQAIRYHETMKRAVSVIAIVEDLDSAQYIDTYYYSGAGDDVERYTKIRNSAWYTLSYSYQNKQYISTTQKFPGSIGEQTEILIDSEHPDSIVSDDPNGMGALKIAVIILCASSFWFISAWIVKIRAIRKEKRQHMKQKKST